MRRLWSKVASPDLEQPARSRWPWFVGGVVTSSALAVAMGVWVLPVLPHSRLRIGSTVAVVPEDKAPVTAPEVERGIIRPRPARNRPCPVAGDSDFARQRTSAPVAPTPVGRPTIIRTSAGPDAAGSRCAAGRRCACRSRRP